MSIFHLLVGSTIVSNICVCWFRISGLVLSLKFWTEPGIPKKKLKKILLGGRSKLLSHLSPVALYDFVSAESNWQGVNTVSVDSLYFRSVTTGQSSDI